jgi:hypothetical protein
MKVWLILRDGVVLSIWRDQVEAQAELERLGLSPDELEEWWVR